MTEAGGWPPGRPSDGSEPPGSGQPRYDQPSYGQAPYEQPGSGQPPYGQPPYGQPQYGQPTAQPTGQPGYDPGGYGGYAPPAAAGVNAQPTQVQGYGAAGGYGADAGYGGYGPPAGPPPKRRSGARIALVIGIVVVVVAGLGVGAWALFLRGGPAVTWQGKEVTDPEAVLTDAQHDLTALVTDAKGVKADSTRCWFAVPSNPPKDTPATDVTDTVYCGPALFVDGDTGKPFIPYGLSASGDGDGVRLTVAAKGSQSDATAVPSGQKLVRPDGVTAPGGAGGLTVPEPPPAAANVFTSVDDLDVPDAPAGATMAALKGGVTVEKLGEVQRYGSGTDARSAPDGQKLLAFQLGEAPGDGASNGPGVLGLQVTVDGGAGQTIPDLSGINVLAVPDDAKSVALVTKADGVAQSISLLDGKPASGNIAVLARTNRLGTFSPPAGFAFTESAPGASASRPCTLSGSVTGLFYWSDDTGATATSSPANAFLETDLKYTYSTNSPAPFTGSNAGDTGIFEPAYLSITLPDGTKIPSTTVSDRTLFEVPAGFTQGTITISGATTNPNGVTFTVTTPVSFTINIPAS